MRHQTILRCVNWLRAATAPACAVVLLPTGLSLGSTTIGGFIASDTFWTASGSPYVASQSVAVVDGATLFIEPGVEVRFDPAKSLLILDGALVARGAAGSNVVFTAHQEPGTAESNRWGYIGFASNAVDVGVSTNGVYTNGCILEHAVIELAGGADVDGAIRSEDCSLMVRDCTIRDNSRGGLYAAFSNIGCGDNQETNVIEVVDEVIGQTGEDVTIYNGVLSNSQVVEGSLQISVSSWVLDDQGDGTLVGNDGTSGTVTYGTGSWSIDLGANIIINAGFDVLASYTYEAGGQAGCADGGPPVYIQTTRFERNVSSIGGACRIQAFPPLPKGSPNGTPVVFVGNEVVSNKAVLGGGLALDSMYALKVNRNSFRANRATNGGGIFARATTYGMAGNQILANVARNGGGIHQGNSSLNGVGIWNGNGDHAEFALVSVTGEILDQTEENVMVYNGSLANIPIVEGSLQISVGGWVLTDQGDGTLHGNDGTIGTISYATGRWSLDLTVNTVRWGLDISASYQYLASTASSQRDIPVLSPNTPRNIFVGNQSCANGGGIYSTNSWLYFRNLIASNNVAGLNGGGCFFSNPGSGYQLAIQDSVFQDNTANGDGGGVYFSGTDGFDGELQQYNEIEILYEVVGQTEEDVTIYSGELANRDVVPGSLTLMANQWTLVDQGDGTLAGNDGMSGTITYRTGSWAVDLGASIMDAGFDIVASYQYVSESGSTRRPAAEIIDTVFAGNTAQANGGGICFRDSGMVCRGLAIVSNTAWGHGAGIYATGATKDLILSGDATNASRIHANAGEVQVYNDSRNTFSADPGGLGNVDARHVWWGTRSGAVIADGVFDFFDDAGKGFVFTEPISSLSLTVVTHGDGRVSNAPAGIYHGYGDTVQLMAMPDPYWRFTTWSNAVAGTNVITNVTIRGDITVDAFFDALLATNSVPLWWLATNGLSTDDGGALSDNDRDGAVAWAEYRAGTDPGDALSVLRICGLSPISNGVAISWTSVSNRTYSILTKPDVAASDWTYVTSGLPATPSVNTITSDLPTHPQGAYRVRLDQ